MVVPLVVRRQILTLIVFKTPMVFPTVWSITMEFMRTTLILLKNVTMAILKTMTVAQHLELEIQAISATILSAQSPTATNVGTANGQQEKLVTTAILTTLMAVITTVPSILAGPVIQALVFHKLRTTSQPPSAITVEMPYGRLASNVTMGTQKAVTLVVRSCLLMSVIQGLISTRSLTLEVVLNAIDVTMACLNQEKIVTTGGRTQMDVQTHVLSIYSMTVTILRT